MPGITLEEAQAHLADAQNDLTKARKGNYSISTGSSSRSVTRDLGTLLDEVKYWNKEVKHLTRGGIPVTGVTPV